MSSPLVRWSGLGALGCLLVLAAAWMLLISPTRATAADLRGQAETQVAANAALQAQIATLREQAAELPAQQAALERVARKVPPDAALPALVRALDELAGRAGVQLTGLNPGVPVPAGAADAATAPAAPPAPPAAGDPAAAGAPAAEPAGPDYAVLPLDLEVVGAWFDVQAFVLGLEELERAVRVTNLQLGQGTADGDATTTTTGPGTLRVTLRAEAYVATEEGA